MKIYKPLSIALIFTATVCSSALAQSYYDDDIYYDASKDVKPKTSGTAGKQTRQQQTTATSAHQYQYVTTTDGTVYVVDELGNAYPVQAQNIPGSDLYSVYTDNTRDVDEYNRRYQVVDTINVDSLARDPFANTRLIEKFSNPDVVTASNDEALINYYANTQPAQINIYMDTPAYYGWSYLSPYYRPYGYWNSWAWDPWYYGTGWYDPYWSWSWSWGWSYPYPGWGWGHPGHGPGWGHHPGWAWGRPQSSPGAFRPHRPGGAAGNNITYTGGYRGGNRGGNSSYTPGTRPSNSNGGYRGNTGRRPGSVGTVNNLGTTRPAPNYNGSSNGGYRYNAPTNNGGRTGGRSNSYNNNNSSRQSTPSYRSSGSSGGSRGSFSGGSRSSGGGSRSGGGGGRGGRH